MRIKAQAAKAGNSEKDGGAYQQEKKVELERESIDVFEKDSLSQKVCKKSSPRDDTKGSSDIFLPRGEEKPSRKKGL